MGFLKNFIWDCKTIVIPLVFVIVFSITLLLLGHAEAGISVSRFGTAFVVLGNIVYIVFFHSRKRWKGDGWTGRLRKLLSFSK